MFKFKFIAVASLIVLVGAGCAPTTPTQNLPSTPPVNENVIIPVADEMMIKEDEGAMMKKDSGAMMDKTGEAMEKPAAKPYYIAYTAEGAAAAKAEGRVTLLYFYAPWCPICRAEEPNIKSWVEGSNLPVAGFRVDYDSETALKAAYKIPYQHTTIILNAKGDEVKRFSGPMTQAELVAALSGAR